MQFVVSMDSMGQDRQFNEDEKKFALFKIKEYRDNWERLEKDNLKKDILRKVASTEKDKEWLETEGPKLQEEEEKYIDEYVASKEDITEDE
jgi:ribosome recycling factor